MSETDGIIKEYTHRYFLTAAPCNPQKELALPALVQQIIEVATEHADILGVGYTRLSKDHNLWVLSRIVIEMDHYPHMHEHYSLTTWIEGYNRHFSERNFEIRGEDDKVIGYARTIWVAINIDTRRPADLSGIASLAVTASDRPCPIDRIQKLRPVAEPQIVNEYVFRVCDIDFNRHVNSTRYIELIIDQLDLATLDSYFISRFEIIFQNEAHFNDHVTVQSAFGEEALASEIRLDDRTICLSRMFFTKRPDN